MVFTAEEKRLRKNASQARYRKKNMGYYSKKALQNYYKNREAILEYQKEYKFNKKKEKLLAQIAENDAIVKAYFNKRALEYKSRNSCDIVQSE